MPWPILNKYVKALFLQNADTEKVPVCNYFKIHRETLFIEINSVFNYFQSFNCVAS